MTLLFDSITIVTGKDSRNFVLNKSFTLKPLIRGFFIGLDKITAFYYNNQQAHPEPKRDECLVINQQN